MNRLRQGTLPPRAGLMIIILLLMTAPHTAIGDPDNKYKEPDSSPIATIPNDTRITPNIIGGVQADGTRFPWAVVFYLAQTPSGYSGRYGFCGGSLIAPRVVLTAAHCLQGYSAYQIRAVIGATRWESSSNIFEVQELYAHPGYKEEKSTGEQLNDIGIVVLKKASKSRVIKLAQPNAVPPLTYTVLGYGTTAEDVDEMSSVLRMVDVPSLSTTTCQQMWDAKYAADNSVGQIKIRPGQSCSAGQPGKDACLGDSGGPIIQRSSNPPDDIQFAVTSFGYGCAETGFPAVNTSIPYFISWVEDALASRKLGSVMSTVPPVSITPRPPPPRPPPPRPPPPRPPPPSPVITTEGRKNTQSKNPPSKPAKKKYRR